MKIICTQENLKSGLLSVGKIVSTNNTLPILSYILIKTENGLLKLSSTNLEIATTTFVRCKIEQEGEFAVLSKTIIELINNLPNQNIIIEKINNQIKIETDNYHTLINILPGEEFPLIPTVEKKDTISIEAQGLKKSLDQVVHAASTNQTQPEISGILMEIEGNSIKIVGTDRYRLAEKKMVLKSPHGQNRQIIVPSKTIMEFSRIIGSQKGEVEMILSETQISLKFNNTEIISRLVDGQYPDYKQIIPTGFTTTITTKKPELINALKTAAIFSQATNSVRFDFDSNKQSLVLTTESQELGKSDVSLAAQVKGDSGTVMLNHRYVLDCLMNIETENVLIKITNDSSPTLFLPEKESDYLYLVMPIKS